MYSKYSGQIKRTEVQQQPEPIKIHDFSQHIIKFPPRRIKNESTEAEQLWLAKQERHKQALKKYCLVSKNHNSRNGALKFIVQKGNNSQVIKRVMQARLSIE